MSRRPLSGGVISRRASIVLLLPLLFSPTRIVSSDCNETVVVLKERKLFKDSSFKYTVFPQHRLASINDGTKCRIRPWNFCRSLICLTWHLLVQMDQRLPLANVGYCPTTDISGNPGNRCRSARMFSALPRCTEEGAPVQLAIPVIPSAVYPLSLGQYRFTFWHKVVKCLSPPSNNTDVRDKKYSWTTSRRRRTRDSTFWCAQPTCWCNALPHCHIRPQHGHNLLMDSQDRIGPAAS